MRDVLMISEEICAQNQQPHTGSSTDILLNSIWKPVAAVLSDRFPGMFNVGVAAAMHRAYSAVERFLFDIPRVMLAPANGTVLQCSAESMEKAAARLLGSAEVSAFRSKWKLDVYFQVAINELKSILSASIYLSHCLSCFSFGAKKLLTDLSMPYLSYAQLYLTVQIPSQFG